MKKSTFTCLLTIFIGIILISGNIYFYSKTEKIDYFIQIGTPISKDSIDFNNPIKNKDDAHTILFALINSTSINPPPVVNKLPDAVFKIDSRDIGLTYAMIYAWINDDDDSVIFKMSETNNSSPLYKSTIGTWGKDIKQLISNYKLN